MGKTDHLKPHQFKPGNKAAKGRPKVDKLKKEELQEIKNISESLQLDLVRHTHGLLNGQVLGIQEVRNNKEENAFKGLLSSVLMKAFNKGDAKSIDTVLNRVIGPVKQRIDVTTQDKSINNANDPEFVKLKSDFEALIKAEQEWQSQISSEPESP